MAYKTLIGKILAPFTSMGVLPVTSIGSGFHQLYSFSETGIMSALLQTKNFTHNNRRGENSFGKLAQRPSEYYSIKGNLNLH